MRVLLIEDHCATQEVVTDHLRDRGYAVDAVRRGDEALAADAAVVYDAVILDLGLPDMDGQELLALLRRKAADRPILILTARDDLDQCVGALDKGADDFIRKPFDVSELEARLRAVLRRPGARRAVCLAYGDIVFDTVSRAVTVAQQAVRLTRRETMLLECLVARKGVVVPRGLLGEQLYGFDDEVGDNALEAVVSRLRRRLAEAGSATTIETIRSLGYRLSMAEHAPARAAQPRG